MKESVYELVTNKIIEKMEQGIIPWKMPWINQNGEGFVSASTKKDYSFLNIMLLMSQGGTQGEYLTFDQIKKRGGNINKGAKSKMVVFFKIVERETTDANGLVKMNKYPCLRQYRVFHISDTDLPVESVKNAGYTHDNNLDADSVVESYVKRSGLKLQSNLPSSKAYYSPSNDQVVVPMMSQYKEQSEFYSTLFHELTHSTGIAKRCDRGLETYAAFGSHDYSREELVAEIGSAMSLGLLGIDVNSTFDNSVAYLQSWIKTLKSDPKAIVIAAGRAEKAVRYIFGDNIDE